MSIVDSTLPDPGLILTVGKDPIGVTLNVNDEAAFDFGYTPRLALGSIDGRVFMDEPGTPGIGNVGVIARSAGPDGIFGRGGDDVFHRVRTEVDGLYLFSDLTAGRYQVAVIDSTLPTGLTITVGSDPIRLTLAEAEQTTIHCVG